ncbi:MAG TPA: hypothetical protein VFH70_11790 [Acidimicrobiales bacterium]|nr:hypothetical protein [Acidimicrobiales bacterium]
MYVPKMIAGLGVGLILGAGTVGTSFAAQLIHSSSAPVGCASVPSGGGEPVGCASRPGNGYGDPNHTHTGAPGQCPPGLARKHQGTPVGCASRPGNGYGDKNHTHTGPPGHPTTPSAPSTPRKPATPGRHSATGKPSGSPVTPGTETAGAPGSHHGKSGQHHGNGKG